MQERAASKFRAPPETPQHPFALKGRQPVPNRWEAAVLKVHCSGKSGKDFRVFDAAASEGGCAWSSAALLILQRKTQTAIFSVALATYLPRRLSRESVGSAN